MLLPVILLTCACLQDPPPPSATQDGVSARDSAAAVAETPDSVRSYLSEAQQQLYDPQAAGLKSLAFDVDADLSMYGLGVIGAVHVAWTAGQEAHADFVANEGLALPPQVPKEMLEQSATMQAQQFLGSMLNRPIASLLDGGVATMAGVQDGLVAVKHSDPAAEAQGVTSQVYLFDEDGTLRKAITQMSQQGRSVTMTHNYSWKPAQAGTELLVAEGQSIEAVLDTPIGPMTQNSSTTFDYLKVGEIVLPIGLATTNKGPMSGEQVMRIKNLVVNGEPAPLPAPAEAAPAAPSAPSGG